MYYFSNDDKFFGRFENDMANGEGEYTKKNGFSFKGFWEDGILQEK